MPIVTPIARVPGSAAGAIRSSLPDHGRRDTLDLHIDGHSGPQQRNLMRADAARELEAGPGRQSSARFVQG